MSTLTFELPDTLRQRLQAIARDEGCSIDQYLTSILSQNVDALTRRAAFQRDVARADRADFDRFLASVPNAPPDPGDELPDGWNDGNKASSGS